MGVSILIRTPLETPIMSSRYEYVSAALGKRELTLAIRNATLLNVFTGEMYESSIGIYKDRIVYVGPSLECPASSRVINAARMVAIPGLIDSHLHVESSMMTPSKFAAATLPHGLTTAFADPHEIANVMGKAGVKAMVDDSRDLPLKLYYFSPTCVPESSAVTAGAELSPQDIEEMLGWDGIWGLGEVMNYTGVLNGEEKINRILQIGADHGAVIDGHAPLLTGRQLDAYAVSGAEADHENFTAEAAVEKLRLGLYVKLRGPYILDPKKFVRALRKAPHPSNLILCTDDVLPDNLSRWGHLDYVCRAFIQAGMDPVEAVRSVTLRPALHMRKFDLGAIAPGRIADVVLVDDIRRFNVKLVVANGEPVAKNGRLLVEFGERTFDGAARETMKLNRLEPHDFDVALPRADGLLEVNTIDFSGFREHEDQGVRFASMILTRLGKAKLKVREGKMALGDIALVFVFERHGRSGTRGFGFARNLIRRGAMATTVAHDSHNLLVVGTDQADMQTAANLVIQSRGGIAAVLDGNTLALVKLPIAGLISDHGLPAISREVGKLRGAFRRMGVLDHPYMPLPNLLALSVIPHARITDKGMFDVDRQEFVPPFVS
jgi:adenine deaminase